MRHNAGNRSHRSTPGFQRVVAQHLAHLPPQGGAGFQVDAFRQLDHGLGVAGAAQVQVGLAGAGIPLQHIPQLQQLLAVGPAEDAAI